MDCQGVVDLTDPVGREATGVALEHMACAWLYEIASGRRPESWDIHDRLVAAGAAGILTPSFANGARAGENNLVLWTWSDRPPHSVRVIDPAGRLPVDQSSWRRG